MCSELLLPNSFAQLLDYIVTYGINGLYTLALSRLVETLCFTSDLGSTGVLELRSGSTVLPKSAPKEDHGDGLVIVSRSDSLHLPKLLRSHHGREVLSRNRRKYTAKFNTCAQHQSIENVLILLLTMTDLMSDKQHCRN